MIHYRQADILEQTDLYAIAHQANCMKHMGAGFAKCLIEKYPLCKVADDRSFTILKADDLTTKLGTYSKVTFLPVDNICKLRVIYNVYSQGRYGRKSDIQYTDYNSIIKAFKVIREELEPIANETGEKLLLGVPHFYGCGLGGGMWSKVDDIFNQIFENTNNVDLVICRL